jgi:hypothetical protein
LLASLADGRDPAAAVLSLACHDDLLDSIWNQGRSVRARW